MIYSFSFQPEINNYISAQTETVLNILRKNRKKNLLVFAVAGLLLGLNVFIINPVFISSLADHKIVAAVFYLIFAGAGFGSFYLIFYLMNKSKAKKIARVKFIHNTDYRGRITFMLTDSGAVFSGRDKRYFIKYEEVKYLISTPSSFIFVLNSNGEFLWADKYGVDSALIADIENRLYALMGERYVNRNRKFVPHGRVSGREYPVAESPFVPRDGGAPGAKTVTRYTAEDLMRFNLAAMRRNTLLNRGLSVIMGAGTIILAFKFNKSPYMFFIGTLLILMGLFYDRLTVASIKKNLSASYVIGLTEAVCFYPDRIESLTMRDDGSAMSEGRYPAENVLRITNDDNAYYVFVSPVQAIVLPRRDLNERTIDYIKGYTSQN